LKISLKPRQSGTWAAALLLSVALACPARTEQLGYHDIKTDSSGKIVPGMEPAPLRRTITIFACSSLSG
jgi:hypothetical protein